MVGSIALGLSQTSGATFSTDEYLYFVVNRGFHITTLLSPHNGNLTLVIRLLYAVVFGLAGPNYLIFRILEFVGVSLAAALFYVLVRRRVGPVAALALTLPLLFLGSSADIAISTIGIQHLLCVSFCLGALLALEADSRPGDVLACLLLTLAVATFSLAFAFIAAAAVSVLLRADRWRRVWIFLIPLAVYLLWLVAAPKYTGVGYLGNTHIVATNLLKLPAFIAQAAAAVVAGVSGLSYNFAPSGLPSQVLVNYLWALPIAVVAGVGLVWRVRRGAVDRWFWSYLAIPLVFWLSVVVALEPNRYPNSDRYIYGGAIAVLLLAAEALRGVRFSPSALAGLLVASAVALTGNIAQLRDDGSILRTTGANVRATLGAIELARDHVAPTFLPPGGYEGLLVNWGGGVGPYLRAVARYGSFAFTAAELRHQTQAVRERADATLVGALRIRLRAAPGFKPSARCLRAPPGSKGLTHLTLRPPGAVLRAAASGPVALGRFGSAATVRVGSLRLGQFAALAIPRDRTPLPWRVFALRGVQELCAPTSSGAVAGG